MVNKFEQIARSYRLLNRSFNSKSDVVKINRGNSLEHELAKFLLCWKLAGEGKSFVTEAVFENGKRADVFVLEDCEAWEVLKSESVSDFVRNKVGGYPCAVFSVLAEVEIKELFLMLKKLGYGD